MLRVFQSIADFSTEELVNILDAISAATTEKDAFQELRDCARGRLLMTLFLQPSIRTRASFTSAFMRMGGNCMCFDALEHDLQSGTSPESVEDVAGFLSQYCDILVVRTPSLDTFRQIVIGSSVPVISAGHGTSEHPTTAINHLHTLRSNFGRLSGLNVLFLAKFPKRCSHSLLLGLLNWPGQTIHIVSPERPEQLDPWIRLGGARESTVRWFSSYEAYCQEHVWQSVDAIILDEGARDYADGSGPVALVDRSFLLEYRANVFLLHLKPILKMVADDIRAMIVADATAESKKACLVRAEIMRRVLAL